MLGPSGSGKTTLLRLIAGLESPDAGAVWIDGRDVTRVPAHRRDVAMVFQNPALYPHLSVFDNIAFGLRARGVPRNQVRAQVNTVAGLLGLDALLPRRPSAALGRRAAAGRDRSRHRAAARACCSATSRSRTSTRRSASRCARRSPSCTGGSARRWSSSRTTSPRRCCSATGSPSSIAAGCSSAARRREVYEHPVHRFVATFIGSPPMNLLPVRAGPRGRPDAHPPDRRRSIAGLDDARRHRAAAWPRASGQVELGIRPRPSPSIRAGPLPAPPSRRSSTPRCAGSNSTAPRCWRRSRSARTASWRGCRPACRFHDRQHLRVALDLSRASWFDPERRAPHLRSARSDYRCARFDRSERRSLLPASRLDRSAGVSSILARRSAFPEGPPSARSCRQAGSVTCPIEGSSLRRPHRGPRASIFPRPPLSGSFEGGTSPWSP